MKMDMRAHDAAEGLARRLAARHRRGPRPGLVGGLVIIAFGTLLFLREWGLLPAEVTAWDLWPLLLIGFCLKHVFSGDGAGSILLSLLVGSAGLLLLLKNLGLLEAQLMAFWPVAIVLLGLAVILKGRRFGDGLLLMHDRKVSRETVSSDMLDHAVSMGGSQIKVDSKPFRGGRVSLMMAGMELDLRQAELPPEGAVLEVRCTLGGLEVRVPSHWRLVVDVAPRLGAVHDGTAPVSTTDQPLAVLTVRGDVTLGAIEFKN